MADFEHGTVQEAEFSGLPVPPPLLHIPLKKQKIFWIYALFFKYYVDSYFQ